MEPLVRQTLVEPRKDALAGILAAVLFAEECLPPATLNPSRQLSQTTVILTVAGEAVTHIHDQPLHQRAGSILAMTRQVTFEERVGAKDPWHVLYIMLQGPWAQLLDRELAASRIGAFFYDPAPPHWADALRTAVTTALHRGHGWDWRCATALSTLLGGIVATPAPADECRPLSERVARLVDTTPERGWSVDELATALHTPPSTLAHHFRQHVGESLAAFVRRRRIALARELLESGLNVSAVARRLGFSDAYHFSRTYKNVTGHPPSAHLRPSVFQIRH